MFTNYCTWVGGHFENKVADVFMNWLSKQGQLVYFEHNQPGGAKLLEWKQQNTNL